MVLALLALCLEITPDGAGGPFVMLGTECDQLQAI